MRRRTEIDQINTLEHWNSSHTGENDTFAGVDSYLILILYYREFLINKGYPDIFGFGSTWLDYGCGSAPERLPLLPLPEGVKYIGCDFADAVLKKNKALRPDLEWIAWPTEGKKYNLISSTNTFEHLDDPQKSWNELWPFVQDVFTVSVPYKESYYSPEHPWEFDENSFVTPTPPIVIVGPQLNLDGDREIIYIWFKNNPPKERLIFNPYKNQYSPQGWYLWHHRLGFSWHYWPMMVGQKLAFMHDTWLYKMAKKVYLKFN